MGNQRAPRTAATRAIRIQQLVNVLRDSPGYTRAEWEEDAKVSRRQSYRDWALALDHLAQSYEPMRSVVTDRLALARRATTASNDHIAALVEMEMSRGSVKLLAHVAPQPDAEAAAHRREVREAADSGDHDVAATAFFNEADTVSDVDD